MTLLLLLACAGRRGPDTLSCAKEPCPVQLQHPSLPEGELYASFELSGGVLVTRRAQGRSVTVLHPDAQVATELADRFLADGVDPSALDAQTWVLAIDDQGVVTEHGARSGRVDGLKLTP